MFFSGCFWLRLGFFPGMAFFVYLQIRIKSASVAAHSLVHFMRAVNTTAGSPVQWDMAMEISHWQTVKNHVLHKWRFPEIGVPFNHPFDCRFCHYKPFSYWGTPIIYGKPRIESVECLPWPGFELSRTVEVSTNLQKAGPVLCRGSTARERFAEFGRLLTSLDLFWLFLKYMVD